MKTQSVYKILGRFQCVSGKDGALVYYSRRKDHGNRIVKVIDQGTHCIALPMIDHGNNDQRVVFHATTIKSLVEFLEMRGE